MRVFTTPENFEMFFSQMINFEKPQRLLVVTTINGLKNSFTSAKYYNSFDELKKSIPALFCFSTLQMTVSKSQSFLFTVDEIEKYTVIFM